MEEAQAQQAAQMIQLKMRTNAEITDLTGKCWRLCMQRGIGDELRPEERECFRGCVNKWFESRGIVYAEIARAMSKQP